MQGAGSIRFGRESLRHEISHAQDGCPLRYTAAEPDTETVRYIQNRRFVDLPFRLLRGRRACLSA